MLKLNLAVAIVFAMAATAHAQPSLSPGPAPAASGSAAPIGAPPPDTLPSPSLTLADALSVAARNNPALRGARADVDASAGALMQAGARPNPEVSFLQEGFRRAERTSTALINQTIELGGKRSARLDVASYGREAANASLDEQGAVVRADVIAAFYGLLAAQRQLQVTEESAAIAARSADLAARRAQAGKVSPVEATKAQVAAAGVQIEVVTARGRVEVARVKLNAVMGEARDGRLAVQGDLEAVPPVEPLSALTAQLDDSPLARIARAEMLRSNAAVSLERARRIPDVTISAGVKRVTTGGVPDNQAVVGVSIPIPL
ncbi:TolC family protein, partial [Burkholderia contaminans]|uniref:TolC family protein n=1 Tax=Burkholderia contaminans TaxID=488447 RepID=UPI00311328C7